MATITRDGDDHLTIGWLAWENFSEAVTHVEKLLTSTLIDQIIASSRLELVPILCGGSKEVLSCSAAGITLCSTMFGRAETFINDGS